MPLERARAAGRTSDCNGPFAVIWPPASAQCHARGVLRRLYRVKYFDLTSPFTHLSQHDKYDWINDMANNLVLVSSYTIKP